MKIAKDSFDTPIELKKGYSWSSMVDKKLVWSIKKAIVPRYYKRVYNDASMHEWGAYCEGISTRGSRIKTEKNYHINALELKPILLSLMSIVKDQGIHIKVFSDNNTAVACINKLGTSYSELCHHITKRIWELIEKKYIFITAAIYLVIKLLMQIPNTGNSHITWNGCFAVKFYIKP